MSDSLVVSSSLHSLHDAVARSVSPSPPRKTLEPTVDSQGQPSSVDHECAQALRPRDIAAALYVSMNTVKTHSNAIFRKLGVGDRKSAVQAARDRHLL